MTAPLHSNCLSYFINITLLETRLLAVSMRTKYTPVEMAEQEKPQEDEE